MPFSLFSVAKRSNTEFREVSANSVVKTGRKENSPNSDGFVLEHERHRNHAGKSVARDLLAVFGQFGKAVGERFGQLSGFNNPAAEDPELMERALATGRVERTPNLREAAGGADVRSAAAFRSDPRSMGCLLEPETRGKNREPPPAGASGCYIRALRVLRATLWPVLRPSPIFLAKSERCAA